MPYEVKKTIGPEGDNYTVVNKDTGEAKVTYGPPDGKEKAERQVHLLNSIENDPELAEKIRRDKRDG